MNLDRRQFLGSSLGAFGLATAPSWMLRGAASAAPSDRILVVLQLAGGNDGLSTVTPKEDDRYYRARPTLAIPKRKLLPLDDLNGFHPSLNKLARHYAEGRVGIHQGVGYPNPNLSHFISQDIWDTASVTAPLPSTGWVGRLRDRAPGAVEDPIPMVAVGRDRMPRALRAEDAVACVVPSLDDYRILSAPEDGGDDERARRLRAIARLQGGDESLSDAWRAADASIAELRKVAPFRTKTPFPGSDLGRDLALTARMIGAGLATRLFYLTQGGYDTHTDQKPTQRKLLTQLDLALDAFLRELRAQGNLDRVLVLAITDFGRRVEESGVGDTVGTDHGAGNSIMAFGGRVNAGMHGGQPDLENLDENGNLVMHTDFRRLYADIVTRWMGGDAKEVLGLDFEPVPVVRA